MSEAIGHDSEPTKHWFYSFLNRLPEIKMIHTKTRDKARDDAVIIEEIMLNKTLSTYFEELWNVLDKYDIKKKPQFIWSVDETVISLDHNPPRFWIEQEAIHTALHQEGLPQPWSLLQLVPLVKQFHLM